MKMPRYEYLTPVGKHAFSINYLLDQQSKCFFYKNRGLDSFRLRNAIGVLTHFNMTFLLSLGQTVMAAIWYADTVPSKMFTMTYA